MYSTKINSDKQRKTTYQFIKDAIQIHGDTYNYSKVKYKNAGEKIIIICKEHGDFLQTPNSHLSKESGCIKCVGCYKSNTEEFIKKSKEIHDDRYDYSKVEYKNVIEKVIIICKEHGDFLQTPNGHLDGRGCYKCGYNMFIFSNNDFINKAKEIHNDKYGYSKINYIKMNEKVIIICKEHGDFEQTPQTHLSGCGCKCCGIATMKIKQKTDVDDFIKNANIIHNNKYEYSKMNYIKCFQKTKLNNLLIQSIK